MNVARASLEELLEDYRDFLRKGGNPLWDKNSREALFVRKLGASGDASYEFYKTYIDTRPPAASNGSATFEAVEIRLEHQR
ncbi:MAG TPA: hypothetical protein VIT21_01695 [Chthoniobacterales bacterium]